jgi:hypothetical protein
MGSRSVEGCDAEIREGANSDWGVVGMCEAGSIDADVDGEGRRRDDYQANRCPLGGACRPRRWQWESEMML